MPEEYKDRFSEAEEELQGKSAFYCETCNAKYSHTDAKEKKMACCDRTLTELLEESFGP